MNRKKWLERVISWMSYLLILGNLTSKYRRKLVEWDEEYKEIITQKLGVMKELSKERSREMKNRRRRGKYAEKKVAKEFGMNREGGVGMRDVGNSMYSIESKKMKIPKSVDNILAQSRRLAKQGTVACGAMVDGRRVVVLIEGTDFTAVTGEKVT